MKKIAIKPATTAPAAGPYSHGVRLGDLLFCAGQVPVVPESNQLIAGDIRVQTARVFENIKLILADQGLTCANIVKTTVYMTNLGDFAPMNETYATFFSSDFPARTTVQVSALPRGAAIEIEAVAHY